MDCRTQSAKLNLMQLDAAELDRLNSIRLMELKAKSDAAIAALDEAVADSKRLRAESAALQARVAALLAGRR